MQISCALEAPHDTEVTFAQVATPKQPVRNTSMTNENAMMHANEHTVYGNYHEDGESQRKTLTVTTPGDLFSPRSAAAMALSAISQQNSLPMNLSMLQTTSSMMATASAAAHATLVSRESSERSASANSSTSSTRKAVSPTDTDYYDHSYANSAPTTTTKAPKVTKKTAATKNKAAAAKALTTTHRPVPNPLAHSNHQHLNQHPNQPPPPPPRPSPHYANHNTLGPPPSLPPPPTHHHHQHPHHNYNHVQHHPHHHPHANPSFLAPPLPTSGAGAGNGNGNGNGNGGNAGNGNAGNGGLVRWGDRMVPAPMSYAMHPHPEHATRMPFHPTMSMSMQQQQQQHLHHHSHHHHQQLPPQHAPFSKGTTRPAPHSMVTPTPKKARIGDNVHTHNSAMSSNGKNMDEAYSRKNKSLGVLASTFCAKYQYAPLGTEIIIDALAVQLGVERRRIYDVVNIFESIHLCIKKGKNTYAWMGKAHMPAMFSLLQHEAVFDYPDDAVQTGIVTKRPTDQEIAVHQAKFRDPKKDKSLTRLSQQFLQLFLIGHEIVSLPDASDMIHGKPDMEDAKEAARSLKTKIRRLYDIANVFMAVGFLRKMDDLKMTLSAAAAAAAVPQRRPCFSWTFDLSPQQIVSGYEQLTDHQKNGRTPFTLKDMMTLRTARPFGGGAAKAVASARAMASGLPAPSKQKQPQQQQQQQLPPAHFSTPRMPPPGSREQQQHHQALLMTDSKMAAGPNAFLANIHQMGGAVLSSEKSKYDGPRRVSLPDPRNGI